MNKYGIAFLTAYMVALLCFVYFCVGCKPSMPKRSDYADNMLPCYLADKTIVANTYTEQKTPIEDMLTKCYRYTDYDRCKDAEDFEKCVNRLRISK